MKSQLARIRQRLEENGSISRNECLSMFPAITRLGARIIDLRAAGYDFETKHENGDYVYYVIEKPKPKQLQLAAIANV